MGEMGAVVLTEDAARPFETFAATMREMDSMIGTRSATGGATARFIFRTLRGQSSFTCTGPSNIIEAVLHRRIRRAHRINRISHPTREAV